MKTIMLLPLISIILFGQFFGLPFTERAASWSLAEDHPVELLTFAFPLLGDEWGLQLVWQTSKHSGEILKSGFYITIPIGILSSIFPHVLEYEPRGQL